MPDVPFTLRAVTDADRPFLRDLYASTREEELRRVPWDAAARDAFLNGQFLTRELAYREQRPDASFLLILQGGEPAGRLTLARSPGTLHLMDLALTPARRGQGLGTQVLRHVLDEADRERLDVHLHVEEHSAARRLYERHGFTVLQPGPVYTVMVRPAR